MLSTFSCKWHFAVKAANICRPMNNGRAYDFKAFSKGSGQRIPFLYYHSLLMLLRRVYNRLLLLPLQGVSGIKDKKQFVFKQLIWVISRFLNEAEIKDVTRCDTLIWRHLLKSRAWYIVLFTHYSHCHQKSSQRSHLRPSSCEKDHNSVTLNHHNFLQFPDEHEFIRRKLCSCISFQCQVTQASSHLGPSCDSPLDADCFMATLRSSFQWRGTPVPMQHLSAGHLFSLWFYSVLDHSSGFPKTGLGMWKYVSQRHLSNCGFKCRSECRGRVAGIKSG